MHANVFIKVISVRLSDATRDMSTLYLHSTYRRGIPSPKIMILQMCPGSHPVGVCKSFAHITILSQNDRTS